MGRPAAAPARSASPGSSARSASAGPRHATRARAGVSPRRGAQRRVSGASAGAVALPARFLRAPFARSARGRLSGLLDALLSGRGWIALVFLLLAGIVFFNVDLLQMNRDIARNADRISALKRANARLRLDTARLGSSERIQEAAAKLGLVLPAPGEVRYREARPTLDAKRAARRITEPVPAVAPEPVWTAPAPTTVPGAESIPPATTTPDTTTLPGVTAAPGTTTTPGATSTPGATTTPPATTTPGATSAPLGATTTAPGRTTTTGQPAG
jgi:cell division protein FtsL